MNLDKVYLKSESILSSYVAEWCEANGVEVELCDISAVEEVVDGLIIVTANLDIDKDVDDIQAEYDKKHIPIRKIDINGTLQVAVSNFDLWMKNNKCKTVMILGSENLVTNENLNRFFNSISKSIA